MQARRDLLGEVQCCPAIPIFDVGHVTASYEELNHRARPLGFYCRHVKSCRREQSDEKNDWSTNGYCNLPLATRNAEDSSGRPNSPVLKFTSSLNVRTGPNSSSMRCEQALLCQLFSCVHVVVFPGSFRARLTFSNSRLPERIALKTRLLRCGAPSTPAIWS